MKLNRKINDGGKCLVLIDSYHYPLLVATNREDDYLLLVNLETSEVAKTEFKSVLSLIGSIPDCVVMRQSFI